MTNAHLFLTFPRQKHYCMYQRYPLNRNPEDNGFLDTTRHDRNLANSHHVACDAFHCARSPRAKNNHCHPVSASLPHKKTRVYCEFPICELNIKTDFFGLQHDQNVHRCQISIQRDSLLICLSTAITAIAILAAVPAC